MSVFERLQRCIPANVKLKFTSIEEMRDFHARESAKISLSVRENCRAETIKKLIGRSGIDKKHEFCSFDNYYTQSEDQHRAHQIARELLNCYLKNESRGFIFSGRTGTGKNHLACAIANSLLARQKSVILITVSDLMMRLRNSYSANTNVSETQIIKQLSDVDLLIIDEVGLQRRNNNEAIAINQIIDNRYIASKPTGLLTNLSSAELVECAGERVVDRLLENDGKWVAFSWDSYRKSKK